MVVDGVPYADLFLSTPSSQRATSDIMQIEPVIQISIHALFAEGDESDGLPRTLMMISIHALFAEGDPSNQCIR